MDLTNSSVGCLVCFNTSENNIFVPAEKSQEIFTACYSYVKNAINVEYLIKNICNNNNKLSFCNSCLDFSLNLTQLVDQLEKFKNDIAELTTKFSKSISERRSVSHATTETINISCNNLKREPEVANICEAARELSPKIVLSDIEESSENNDVDTLDPLLVIHPSTIEDQNVKCEDSYILSENEGFFINLSYNENEFNCNNNSAPSIDPDPLEQNDYELNLENAKSEREIRKSSSLSSSEVASNTTLRIESARIPEDVSPSPSKISRDQDEPEIILIKGDASSSGLTSLRKRSHNQNRVFPCTSSSSAMDNRFISKAIAKPTGKYTSSKVNYKNFKTSLNKLNSKRQEQKQTQERPLDTQVAKRYHCNQCPTVFSIRESYMKHRRIAHGIVPQRKPYFCRVGHCDGKSFREVKRRDRHEDFCRRHFV